MRLAASLLIPLSTASLFLAGRPAVAMWPQNGTPVCTQSVSQTGSDLAPDGTGGAFVVWTDSRSGSPKVFVQRVDGWGNPLWATNGIPLTSSPASEQDPKVVADGSGGAIAMWHDSRNSGTTVLDIYAQRVDAFGNLLWGASGLAVCAQPNNQFSVALAPDGAGGVLATWLNDAGGGIYAVNAQRVSAGGTLLWNPAGVAVSNMSSGTGSQLVVGDGLGGGIIIWQAYAGDYNVYAQRVTAAGNAVWGAGGTSVCTAPDDQYEASLATDGTGGAIVVWQDRRNYFGTLTDIYAQRMYASGTAAWAPNGIPVCSQGDFQFPPTIAADRTGGAIIAWGDYRNGMGQDQYVQRVGPSGAMLWTPDGVGVGLGLHDQFNQQMVPDGAGGAVIAWEDMRGGNSVREIYAQRVNGSGVVQWTPDGVVLCNAVDQQYGLRLAPDGIGGAVVSWTDFRNGNEDIYAQRIERNGFWGFPAPEVVSARDVPGDQGGLVNIAWDASRLDPWPDQMISTYTVWRAIDATTAASAEALGAETILHGVEAVPTDGEVVRVQAWNGALYYWQLMVTVNAYSLPGYAQTVATLFDSTSVSSEPHYFQVMAHTWSQYWASAPVSGRSVDNLAPAAPLTLTAQRVGFDVDLVWNRNHETDLDHYAIYRATSAGVQPIPIHFIDSSTDTVYTDASPPPGYLFYVVAARDVHENQSSPSNEAAVTIPTGVGDDTPALTRLSLAANVPNPFSHATELRVGLPGAGPVEVEVYDVAGRRVFTRRYDGLPAGWNRLAFEARGTNGAPLPSGVYFYRVTTSTETLSQKLVIQR